MQSSHHNRSFVDPPAPPLPLSRVFCTALRSSFSPHLPRPGFLTWLPTYTLQKLLLDGQAALTIAVILVPQGMAYAMLAGLQPVYGLYSSTIPVIVFGLFTSSSRVAPGPVAPTAIVLNSMVSSLTKAPPFSPGFLSVHVALACVSGCMQLVLGLVGWTWMSSLVSFPVMSGFATGAGMVICATQLKDFFGLVVPAETLFFMKIYRACERAATGNWRTTLLSLGCLYVLLQYRTWKLPRGWSCKNVPVPMLVILLTTLLSWAANFAGGGSGIALVGAIPTSLPTFSPPLAGGAADVALVAPNAVILAFVNFIQAVSLAVIFGKKCSDVVVPAQEMWALGFSSLVGSFFSCYTISGSFTRSTVQHQAGPATPAATVLTGLLMVVFVVTITRILPSLPVCVLAAVVVASTKQLFATDVARDLWAAKRSDFAQFALTVVAVLFLDVVYGLLAGIAFSFLLILWRSFFPSVSLLGRLPGTNDFVRQCRFTEARPDRGFAVVRLDGELHFGNVARLTDKLRILLSEAAAGRGAVAAEADSALAPPALTTTAGSSSSSSSSSGGGGICGALTGFFTRRPLPPPAPQRPRVVYTLCETTPERVQLLLRPRTAGGLQAGGGGSGSAPQLALTAMAAELPEAEDAAPARGTEAVLLASAPEDEPPAPPPPPPLRTVIVDCGRLTDIDSTACNELLALRADFRAARAEVSASSGSGAATPAEGAPFVPQLLFATMTGGVRDTWDAFERLRGAGECEPRFLSVAAAVAFVKETEEEAAGWEAVAQGLGEEAAKAAEAASTSGKKGKNSFHGAHT